MNTPKYIKYSLLAVMIIAAQAVVWGQSVTITYSTPGSHNATIPCNATSVTGTAWGGGGGGGGADNNVSTYYTASAGGGSGGYIKKDFGNSLSGGSIGIVVGTAGTAGSTSPSNGGIGGQSSIVFNGFTIWANGGNGGASGKGSSWGSGGSGGTTSANGDAYSTGNPGTDPSDSGSSRMSGKGGDAPNGGAGGAAVGGGTGSHAANPGTAPGGGGSGSRTKLAGDTQAGGVGGAGRAIISFSISRPVIDGDNSYCVGDALALTVTNPCASASYTWKLNGTTVGTGTTLSISSVATTNAGTYTVECSMSGYAYASGSVSPSGGVSYSSNTFTISSNNFPVTVNPMPTLTLTSASNTQNQTLCSGTAMTSTTYTFGGSATGASVSNLPAGLGYSVAGYTLTISGTPSSNGTYTVSTTGGSCGAKTINGTITVNPAPTLVLISGAQSPTVCAGTTITNIVYTFGGGATGVSVANLPAGLSYSVTDNTLTISGTPTAVGSYTVSTTGQTAPCTSIIATGTVTVNPAPTLVLTSGVKNPTVCEGSAITNIVFTFGGGATNVSVSNLTGTGLSANVNTSAKTVTISGIPNFSSSPINYTITTTGQLSPCTGAIMSGTITVNPVPVISTKTTTVCSGETFTITPQNGVGGDIVPSGTDYTWLAPSHLYVTGMEAKSALPSISGTLTNTTNAPQTVIYLVTPSANGCTGAQFQVMVTVNPKPFITPKTLTVCSGQPFQLNPTNGGTDIVPIGTTYNWSTPAVPAGISGAASGSGAFDISGTLTNSTGKAQKIVYTVIPNAGTCIGASFTVEVVVVVTEIISITPASGPVSGGIYTDNPLNPINPTGTVKIVGSGFAPFGVPVIDQVTFGGIAAINVTVIDNDTITCTPPAQFSSGYVTVSVSGASACGTANLVNGYQYVSMNITDVTPDYAPVTGGTTITIKGTGLLAAGCNKSNVWVKLCGVLAIEIVSATDNQIVCITGTSNFSKLGSIEIYNGVESREFANRFTYYPVVFIVNGVWSEPYNWETQTDDRILPYPGAIIHIKANCLQDIDLIDGYSYPNGKMDSITVYPNKAYTLDSGITMDANVFVLKDDASFLNLGTMQATLQNVEHALVQGRNWYVSSPLATAQTINAALGTGTLGGNLTTAGNVNLSSELVESDWRVEWYDEPYHKWQRLPLGSNFTTGLGYTVFSKNEDIAVKFSGIYNDGNQTSPILTRQNDTHLKRGFNLVGNPFPSYWQWTEAAASIANVYSTIWYRTHVADIYEFWSYNAAGDVAVAPGWNDGTPTGSYSLAYIPPMQAFWVRLRDGQIAGSINFANNLRFHADHLSNILKSSGKHERPMIRIALSGSKNTDETLVYADIHAQNGFDDYDSDKWFTGTGVEIFTWPVAENRELVINGVPKISDGMEIPLGFLADEGGSFNCYAKEILNLNTFDVFLRDKWRNLDFNLRTDGIYNFTSGSTLNTERFSVVFRSAFEPSDIDKYNAGDGQLLARFDKDGNIVVMCSDNRKVTVYDIMGKVVAVQSVVSNVPTVIKGKFMQGMYVLRAGNYTTKMIFCQFVGN